VQCRAHRPLEHIQGFTRSHWMLPSGECLCLIAQAAAMVDKLVATKHQTRTKHFLPSDYRTVLFKNRVTFGTRNRPSTQHVETTSCVKMWDTTIGAEELVDISSYQMLLEDTNSKSYQPWMKRGGGGVCHREPTFSPLFTRNVGWLLPGCPSGKKYSSISERADLHHRYLAIMALCDWPKRIPL
jgi:hypothetical protein